MRGSFTLILLCFSTAFCIRCGTPQALEDFISTKAVRLPPSMQASYGTKHFKVWYDTTGVNAVYPGDADEDGVPDYVEAAGEYLEHAWRIVVDSLGFRPPIPDTAGISDTSLAGGDARVDVYLVAMGTGVYGETQPRVVDTTENKATAYVRIQSDMTRIPGYADDPYPALAVTCAHEFFHTVQFAYFYPFTPDDAAAYRWWMEQTAVFCEELCFDEVNDYYSYVSEFQSEPWVPFNADDDVAYYGGVMFPLFLAEHFCEGSRLSGELIKSIWERCEDELPLYAISDELEERGSSLTEAYEEFVAWRVRVGEFWREGFFAEGANYPLPAASDAEPPFSQEGVVAPFGTNFFRLDYALVEGGVSGKVVFESGVSGALIAVPVELPGDEAAPWRRADPAQSIDIPGRWQYRAIYFAVLPEVSPTPQARFWFDVTECSAESCLVPIFAQNEINDPYPNPCATGSVTFPFRIAQPAEASVVVFAADGALVWRAKREFSYPQSGKITWDCRNLEGKPVAPGVYIYVAAVGDESTRGKLLIVR